MTPISLQVPQAGLPNTTEDAKVSSDLTIIQTWANGNINDTDLLSPSNAVRRVLLQTVGVCGGTGASGQSAGVYYFAQTGFSVASGSGGTNSVPMWYGDLGISGQPQDYQVANKTAYARIRVSALSNAVALAANLTWGLYQVTAVSGTGANLVVTLAASPVAGSTAAMNAPVTGSALSTESAQFALPIGGQVYVIGCAVSGTTSAGSAISFTASLLGYNA